MTARENQYPWYRIAEADDGLEQGDFFDSCPVVMPSMAIELGNVTAEVVEYDVIVMSQSCDLKYEKVDLVVVCPIWPFDEFAKRNDFFRGKTGKEALRQGYAPGYHLLSKCDLPGFQKGYLIVDFHNVYGIPFKWLMDLAKRTGQRLRLLSPYKEHLSQAFARFFMRVGLPVDIPRDF